MSLINDILSELWNYNLNYKGVVVNLFGIPKFSNYNRRSISSTLHRLKTKDFITKNENGYTITPRGKKYFEQKARSLKNFEFYSIKNKSKKYIVIFDIPEDRKAEREWFRFHLRKLGFSLVQKSVWVGPSPFPREFTEYLKSINLEETYKVFKLAKELGSR